ncbi:Histidine kinase 3 [Camellia lanceoleosa]|uniref:Histidine kinase 3 n=1 Tax=Camellia lanceoleosa TaxID=1840588 RepID=A0ACC0IYE2_9ERIC|nr:Histidine kinase 3 [Camellia lanceoleosa]
MLWYMSSQAVEKRKETLASMCDERARMLQDPFNVSMNHVQAMSIVISTFHHGKRPSAIDQDQDSNAHMVYLLSNTFVLLFLLQRTLKATEK